MINYHLNFIFQLVEEWYVMVWSNFLALPKEKEEGNDVNEDFIDDNENYDDTMINMMSEATCHAFHPCIHTGHCQHRKWEPGWSLVIYHHHHFNHISSPSSSSF